ncbi:9988_t:CDS:2, partial [Ambispora leptoticha]
KEPIHVTATNWIFHKLYIDCLGPLPRTAGGHEHVVLAVKELTGNVEGKALRRKNANAIAQFIWDEANGRAERTVQKFTRIIRKLCAEKQNKWHEYVRSAIWAINITINNL